MMQANYKEFKQIQEIIEMKVKRYYKSHQQSVLTLGKNINPDLY